MSLLLSARIQTFSVSCIKCASLTKNVQFWLDCNFKCIFATLPSPHPLVLQSGCILAALPLHTPLPHSPRQGKVRVQPAETQVQTHGTWYRHRYRHMVHSRTHRATGQACSLGDTSSAVQVSRTPVSAPALDRLSRGRPGPGESPHWRALGGGEKSDCGQL